MRILGYAFGAIGIVAGLWQLLAPPKEGQGDYYLSMVGGVIFIMMVAFVVKWGLDPLMAQWGRQAQPALGFNFASVMNLNYVVMGIIAGIVIVNVFKVPAWAENGVRLSRLGLKTGVILLGALYSLAELAHLGRLSVVLIGVFVLGSVGFVLWLGVRRNMPNSMTGVLAAGVGVCGVSAAVAVAPVVKAKSTEIAYTIGTILLFGVICMFLFPIVGKAMGMGFIQFGAWAGTGILNSAQVAGAALAFQPNGIETLKVAEIFNITRVLFLPIIVLWLAVWYVKREEGAQKVDLVQVIVGKFPVFVLGFILMFALSSTGIFAPAQHYQGSYFDNSEKAMTTKDKEGKIGQQAARRQGPRRAEGGGRQGPAPGPEGRAAEADREQEADVHRRRRHAARRGQRQDHGQGGERRAGQGAPRGASHGEEDRHVPRPDRLVLHLRPGGAGDADHHRLHQAGRRAAAGGGQHRGDHQGGRLADRGVAAGGRNDLNPGDNHG